MTELATTQRRGHARVIEKARHARQAFGVHDRVAGTVGEFYHNREFSVATDLNRA